LFRSKQCNINRALRFPMLKCIIQDRDSCSELDGLRNSVNATLRYNDWNLWVEMSVNQWLVAPVATKNHCGSCATICQFGRKPRGKRSLSSSTNRKIPNTHNCNCGRLYTKDAMIVHPSAHSGNDPIRFGERSQYNPRRFKNRIVTAPDFFDQAHASFSVSPIAACSCGTADAASRELLAST
jgi:hypothetical protein